MCRWCSSYREPSARHGPYASYTAGIVKLLKSLKTQSHRPRWHSKPHIQDLCQRISWSTAAYLPSLIRPRPRCCSRWLEGSSHSTCFQERRLSEPSKLPTDLPHLCLQQNNETRVHSSIMFMLQSISNATTFYQTNNMASVKNQVLRDAVAGDHQWPCKKYRRIKPNAILFDFLLRYNIPACYSNLSTTASEISHSTGLQTSSVVICNTSCWMASSLPRHLSHLALLKAQSSAPYFLFTSMISQVEFVPQCGCLMMIICCTVPSRLCMTPTHSNPTLTVSSNGKRTGWWSSTLPMWSHHL